MTLGAVAHRPRMYSLLNISNARDLLVSAVLTTQPLGLLVVDACPDEVSFRGPLSWADASLMLLGRLRRALSLEARGGHFAAVLFMGPLAALAILSLREIHLVARTPIWLIPLILVCGQSLTTTCGLWWDRSPNSRGRLHARIGSQAIVVTATIYATGWGPALAVGLVLVGQEALAITGSSSQRVVVGWSLACLVAGEGLIALGWAPSIVPVPEVHGLAVLVAIGIMFSYRSLRSALIEKEHAAAQHRAVVENAAEGIYTVSLDGTIRSFNAAAEAMFGWAATDIIGLPVTTLTPVELHDALAAFLASFESAEQSVVQRSDIEIGGVRRDGSQFPMLASTSAIIVEGSAPIISCIARDLSQQKHFEAQLAHQALHDTLTGLPNRSMFTDHLGQALARIRRNGRMCSVLFVDLDRFKIVNDTLGHAAGDMLLIEAGARIRNTVRETDTVARLGGDEFVVFCEDIESVPSRGRSRRAHHRRPAGTVPTRR